MSRFVQGADRRQPTLLPECLDDYVTEDNPVRVVDVFVDELDLKGLGFDGMTPAATGRPAYHPAMLLKLYVYGYLNKVQSSRRLEREAQRNVELMWLTGRLAPDHKTIADFRRENGAAIQAACAQFVVLCRQLGLFGSALVAIDGSKFKAVNTRDKNFTAYKVKRRIEQVAEHITPYEFICKSWKINPIHQTPGSNTKRTKRKASPEACSRRQAFKPPVAKRCGGFAFRAFRRAESLSRKGGEFLLSEKNIAYTMHLHREGEDRIYEDCRSWWRCCGVGRCGGGVRC